MHVINLIANNIKLIKRTTSVLNAIGARHKKANISKTDLHKGFKQKAFDTQKVRKDGHDEKYYHQ